jgi:hypothetical protein
MERCRISCKAGWCKDVWSVSNGAYKTGHKAAKSKELCNN